MNEKKTEKKTKLTICTKSELAIILDISMDTLRRKLHSIGVKNRKNYLNIKDLKAFDECFGLPPIFVVSTETFE